MADPFRDILPSLTVSKTPLEGLETGYPDFVVNRALSYNPEDIYYVNLINQCPDLPGKVKYLFLLNTLKRGRRPFNKWGKPVKHDGLEAVKQYYSCSSRKALEVINLLTEEELDHIIKKMKKDD